MRMNIRCLTTCPLLYHTFPEAYVVNTLTSTLMCRDLLTWLSSSVSIHTVRTACYNKYTRLCPRLLETNKGRDSDTLTRNYKIISSINLRVSASMEDWKMTMLTVTKARKCNGDIN